MSKPTEFISQKDGVLTQDEPTLAKGKTLVIIPTFNESENIKEIILLVFKLNIPALDILVVDDNSPDATADVVESLMSDFSNLFLKKRPGKLGLGTAYVVGFKYAIENQYDFIVEMDADLSHDPQMLPQFLKEIQTSDLVIGSRYINEVSNVVNWPLRRLMLSKGASLYTQIITRMPIKDPTSGFKCFRRKVLEAINLDNIHSGGYSFQIEMNFKAWNKGFKLKEMPIIFVDRTVGKSKMSKKIIWEAIWMVWGLKFKQLFKQL